VLFAAAWIVAAGAGCSSGSSSPAASRVVITEHDFGLQASVRSVRAGAVTMHVVNRGPSTHELNIDRTSFADGSLPLMPDGLTVNEDSPAMQRVDSVSVVRLGASQDLHLRLAPGHYVLYCNLEGHYLGTMHTSLEVTA
jgi:uncharacterized cupredoxin-like copper-binding protein